MKEFADDSFKLHENVRKFSKWVENSVGKGKGEIARYEQFLLFLQCFQKTRAVDTLKPGLVWEMIKKESRILTVLARRLLQTLWDTENNDE